MSDQLLSLCHITQSKTPIHLARSPYSRPSMWMPNDDNLDYDMINFKHRLIATWHAFEAGIAVKFMVENRYLGGLQRLGMNDFTFSKLWNGATLNFLEEIDQFTFPMPSK